MSLAGMLKDDEHTIVIASLCTLTGRVWINGRHVKRLFEPSVEVLSTDATVHLVKEIPQWVGGSGQLGGSSSSASERSKGWRGKGKKRGGSSGG